MYDGENLVAENDVVVVTFKSVIGPRPSCQTNRAVTD
jgi:hypothetical protein